MYRQMRRVDLLVEARKHTSGNVGRGREVPRRLRAMTSGLRSSRLLGSPSVSGGASKSRFSDLGADEAYAEAASAVYAAPPVQPRDLRLIDPIFAASQDPAILPRRGCIVLNLPPVRAIITRSRCFFIPDKGVDEQLRTLANRIRVSAESADTAESAAAAAAAASAAAAISAAGTVGSDAGAGSAGEPARATALPWELHVLEALLLTVTTTLRKDIAAVEPHARHSLGAGAGGKPREPCSSFACCTRVCDCFVCCREELSRAPSSGDSPGGTVGVMGGGMTPSHAPGHIRALSASDKGIGMIASMAVVRRELARVQEHGRALSRCLEDLLESPLAMARLDLSAVDEAVTAEAERAKRRRERKSQSRRAEGGAARRLGGERSQGRGHAHARDAGQSIQHSGSASSLPAVAEEGAEDSGSRSPVPALASTSAGDASRADKAAAPAASEASSSDAPFSGGSAIRTPEKSRSDTLDVSGVEVALSSSPKATALTLSDAEGGGGIPTAAAATSHAPPPLVGLRGGHGYDPAADEEAEDAAQDEDEETTVFFGDAVELLLESYLGEVEAAMSDARTMQADTETAERQLSLVLAASRNALLRVDVTVSVVSVALSLLAVVGGFMGMNVPNGLEAADTGIGGPFFAIVLTSCVVAVLMTLLVLSLLQRFLRVTNE